MKSQTTEERNRIQRIRIVSKLRAGRGFIVKTSIAAEYLAHLREWILSGAHGAMVYGDPRLGKTMGTRWAIKMLPRVLGHSIPHIWVPTRTVSLATDRAFFMHLLHCAKHRDFAKGTTPDKRARFSRFLIAKGLRNVFSTVILVFDEAHNLKPEHFQWLLEVGNELEEEGVSLFCLFFGQPSLVLTKYKLIQANFGQVVNRYMVEMFQYRGIESAQKFLECMIEFDNTHYPADDGPRWHSIFFADLEENECPLVEAAPMAWEYMTKISQTGNAEMPTSIPMFSVCRYVTNLVNYCANGGGIRPNANIVKKAILRCGLRENVALKSQSELLPMNQATTEIIRSILENQNFDDFS